jgi:hypothetical protein
MDAKLVEVRLSKVWPGTKQTMQAKLFKSLSSPWRFVEVKILLRLLLLGSWNPRWLSGLFGDLILSCGDLPKLCCASVVTIGSLQLSCGVCINLCGFVVFSRASN